MTDRIWLVSRFRRQRAELRYAKERERWLKAEISRLGKELSQAYEAEHERKTTDRTRTAEVLHKAIAEFLHTQTFPSRKAAVLDAMAEFDVKRSTVYEVIDAMEDMIWLDEEDDTSLTRKMRSSRGEKKD